MVFFSNLSNFYRPNRCGDRYGGGMFSGGCRLNRPVCRTRCSIKPTCGGNNWQYGNNGNSFGCGNGGGNMGYNPGYGYNPSINYPSQASSNRSLELFK